MLAQSNAPRKMPDAHFQHLFHSRLSSCSTEQRRSPNRAPLYACAPTRGSYWLADVETQTCGFDLRIEVGSEDGPFHAGAAIKDKCWLQNLCVELF
jgi:hypothetical protein